MITEQNKYADIQQYVNYDNRASRGDQSPVQKEIMGAPSKIIIFYRNVSKRIETS